MKSMRWSVLVVAIVGALSAGPARVGAQQDANAPDSDAAATGGTVGAPTNDRRMYVSFGLGPAASLRGGGALMKLEQSFGYHLVPTERHPGLFVGAALSESFRSGGTRLQVGGRVGYDFRVFSHPKVDLLVAPMATLGAALYFSKYTNPFTGDTTRDTFGAFHLGLAGEVRAVVAQGRVTVWARPVGLDFDIGNGTGVYWDVLFGANYNF